MKPSEFDKAYKKVKTLIGKHPTSVCGTCIENRCCSCLFEKRTPNNDGFCQFVRVILEFLEIG